MFNPSWFATGLIFLTLGVLALVLFFVGVKIWRRLNSGYMAVLRQYELKAEEANYPDAVIVIRRGGSIASINNQARQWFGLDEYESITLERIARQIRPSERFLSICVRQDKARLAVAGRMADAVSYRMLNGDMMVVLRPAAVDEQRGGEISEDVLEAISVFGQEIVADREFDETLRNIFFNLLRLVPYDLAEIKLFENPQAEAPTIYRVRTSEGDEREKVIQARVSQFGSLYRQVLEAKKPILHRDVRAIEAGRNAGSVRSYIGLPLFSSGRLFGALEIGQVTPSAYSDNDVYILNLVLGQIATAIQNALSYRQEQRRMAEISSIARLVESAGAIQEPEEIIGRVLAVLEDLFPLDMIGIVVYDDFEHTLRAVSPFRGLSDDVVGLYRTHLSDDQSVRSLLDRSSPIVAEDAASDWTWQVLGLQGFAQAASVREAVLAPLRVGDNFIGFLHLSNHTDGQDSKFSDDELRLIRIFAAQVAVVLNNAFLVRRMQQRAARADVLRRLSMLSASAFDLNDVLVYAAEEMARLLDADYAAFYLLDESESALHLHEASLVGLQADDLEVGFRRLYVDDPAFPRTVTGSRRPFFSNNLEENTRLLSIYRPFVDELEVQSAIVVPLYVREKRLGEWMIGARRLRAFTEQDLHLLVTAAGQLSLILDDLRQKTLSNEELQQQVDAFLHLVRTSRLLHVADTPNNILHILYNELQTLIGSSCGYALGLERDESGRLSIVAAAGETHGVSVAPVERIVYERRETIIIPDFERSQYAPPHENVRSAMLTPILHGGEVIGLLYLHSEQAKTFGERQQFLAETLAHHAGIAWANLKRYQREAQARQVFEKRTRAMEVVDEFISGLYVDRPLEEALEQFATLVRQVTPFTQVLFSVYDEERAALRRVAGVGLPANVMNELRAREQSWSSVQQLLRPIYQAGRGYFIPYDQAPVVPPDVHIVTTANLTVPPEEGGWHPQDLLLFPLLQPDGAPLGLLSVDAPTDGMRPDRVVIDILGSLVVYVERYILAYRTIQRLKSESTRLAAAVNRLEVLRRASAENLPTLLHKDLEQALAVQKLARRSERIRAGLRILESVSRQVDVESALRVFAQGLMQEFNLSYALLAEQTVEGPRLALVLGSPPENISMEALFGQRNPLRAVLQNGEALFAADLDEDADWQDASIFISLRAKSFVCLPVVENRQATWAVMGIGLQPLQGFTQDDAQVFRQIARQVSLIVENLHLLVETSRSLQEVQLLLDFSQRIADLQPEAMVQVLLNNAKKVINEAHAGVVFLWDESRGELVPQAVSGYSNDEIMRTITYARQEALPGRVFAQGRARRIDELNFAAEYDFSVDKLMRYQNGVGGRLPLASLLVPIRTSDRLLGLIMLDNFNAPGAFSAQDEALLDSLARQMALALENYRLVNAAQERVGRLQGLYQASVQMGASLSRQALVDQLLPSLQAIVPYDTAIFWLRDGDTMRVAAADGFENNEERIGLQVAITDSQLLHEMIRQRTSIAIADVREDDRFPSFVDNPNLSWLGVPLIIGGQVEGVFALEKHEAAFYRNEYIQLANNFAAQVSVALQNARLYEESVLRASELADRSERLALLNEFSASLSSLLDKEKIYSLTMRGLMSICKGGRIYLVEFDHAQRPVWTQSLPATARKLPQTLPAAPLFERVAASGGLLVREDVHTDPDFAPLHDILPADFPVALVVPFSWEDRVQAALLIQVPSRDIFGPDELELMRTIANQASIALQNASLYDSVVRTADRLNILNQVSTDISASLDLETVYSTLHWAVGKLMPTEAFVISLLDEEAEEIEGVFIMEGSQRIPPTRIPFGEGLSSRVIREGRPLMLQDANEPGAQDGVTFGSRGHPNSILAVPLVLGGRPRGMLSVQSYQENAYTEEDLNLLMTLANQAAVAINNAQLFSQLNQLTEDLEARVIERTAELDAARRHTEFLLKAFTEVSSSLDLEHSLRRTLELLHEAIGAEQGTIMMLDPADGRLHYRAGYGYVANELNPPEEGLALRPGEGLAGWVLKNRKSTLVYDLYEDPRWVPNPNSGAEHRSAIAVPMKIGEELLGVLLMYHRDPAYFTQDQLNIAEAIASQVSIAINNATLYQLISEQSEQMGKAAREQRLEASRRAAILASVADGVVVTDVSNRIEFVNESALKILGVDEEDILGQALDAFAQRFGKTAAVWIQTIRSWSENPASYQETGTYAEQLTLDDGRIIFVNLAPVVADGEFIGTVSIIRDITYEVEVDRLKSEFVATVSHELRTPMTSIRGYVDLLMMGAAGALNENQQHFLEIIKENTVRLNVLVNDLLDVSQIEAGKVALEIQPVHLPDLAHTVVDEVQQRSVQEQKPIHFHVEAEDDLPAAAGDPDRVRQILANLVENAFRYTPEDGSVTIRIHRPNEDFLQVDVEDTGIGIAPEDQERIFERFYRGEHPFVLATAGTGLGLALTRQLVNMHQGEIWVQSVLGQGSTFSFTIPVYQKEEA